MEENQKSSFKVALNYALITGILLIVLDLVFYVMDVASSNQIKNVSWLIYIVGIIWGQKVYRDTHAGGFMSYGKSFSVGFTIGFFAAIMFAIYHFVFVEFFDDSIIQQTLATAEENLLASGEMSDDQIDAALEMSAKFSTPLMMSLWIILFGAIGNAIISLVTSIFMKKEAN